MREDLEAILTATACLLGSETAQGREAAVAIAIHVAPEPLVARLQPQPVVRSLPGDDS